MTQVDFAPQSLVFDYRPMAAATEVVFLLDVDDTLLDNDRFEIDLSARLEAAFGATGRERYWAIFAQLRDERGYADHLATLQRFRVGLEEHSWLLQMSAYLLEYPVEQRLYPNALEAIAHLGKLGLPVVFSDGDIVFQPLKIRRAAIWDAIDGRVLIYPHRERKLAAALRRWPASHYVAVGGKPQALAAMKRVLGAKLTTVLVRQTYGATESLARAADPRPDLTLRHIGDLLHCDREQFLPRPRPTTANRKQA